MELFENYNTIFEVGRLMSGKVDQLMNLEATIRRNYNWNFEV